MAKAPFNLDDIDLDDPMKILMMLEAIPGKIMTAAVHDEKIPVQIRSIAFMWVHIVVLSSIISDLVIPGLADENDDLSLKPTTILRAALVLAEEQGADETGVIRFTKARLAAALTDISISDHLDKRHK